jgi:hypothetical protein
MKKLFSLFVAMMAAFSLSAKTIYCEMSQSWWTADGAAVGIYTWNDNGDPKAAWPGERMTLVEGTTDVWSFDLDTEIYHMCIFTRVNGEGDVADFGAKTGDQLIPTDDKNLFTITSETAVWGDPGCDGVWSVYGEEPVDPFANIVIGAAKTADELAENEVFAAEGSEFSATIYDSGNKMVIDSNACRFGTAEAYQMYRTRLKSGGASGSDKNYLSLNIPAAGTLRVAPRSASGTATDRALFILQGNDTLYKEIVMDAQAIEVVEGEGTVKVFPYVSVPVAAGSVIVRYSGSMNFYGFGFQAAETPEPVLPSIALIGGMNGWDGSKGEFVAAADKASASLTLDLAEMPQEYGHAFKLLVDGVAMGSERVEGNPFTFTRENNTLSPVDHVAVGDDEIFWLVMDVTGEYTFTYTFADSSLVVTYPAVSHTYTVAGDNAYVFGTTWDVTNTSNDMELQEDNTYKWEKENLELPVGNVEFKVAQDHSWSVNYPKDNYVLAIAESGSYTITITFNPEGNVVSAEATKTGDADVTPSVAMHGDFTKDGWKDTENFTIAEDKASASLTLTLAADRYEFGMRIGGSGNWTANGAQFSRENPSAEVVAGSGNLVLTTDVDGEYTFTWTYATNTLAITFPAKEEGIAEVVAAGKAAKVVRDGQLLILKGNKTFNAQGAIVR